MHKHVISIAKAFALVAFLAWGLLFPLHSNGIEPQLSPQPWVIKRYPIDKNKLNGNRQFSNVKSSTNRPFVVQVTDTLGNAISRAEVYFTITSWPDKANGQRLTTYSTVTDSLGQAHTTIFLGDTEGEYIVSAGVKSSIPNQVALFTATAR
ncbi:MAG TPA: Ig-like domain-containing protein, partial [Tenuifilaceae bacterium]|nr:Ig-like domain-containing protein [Tenuifilaceae bacterium]